MFLNTIKEIHVEPTTVCQAECPMCPRTLQGYHLGKVPNTFLTLDRYIEKTHTFVSKLDKVLFCGTLGEPAACGDLLDMIRWTLNQNNNCVIGMNSNGGIKDPAWWSELAALTKHNPYNYVVFSIDGLEHTNHIYRKNVDWNKVMENVKAYIDAGGAAQWDMLVFRHNEHEVDLAKDLAQQMGFKFFRTKVTSRFTPGDGFEPPSNHTVESSKTEFECEAQKQSSLYLSAAGLWYPCCYTHMSNETDFDRTWGNPIRDVSDIGKWDGLAATFGDFPPRICNRSCGTTHNKGQWTSEYQLNV